MNTRSIIKPITESMLETDYLHEVISSPYEYQFTDGQIPMWNFMAKDGEDYSVILTPVDMRSIRVSDRHREDTLFVLGYARSATQESTELTGSRDVFNILATVEKIVREFVDMRYQEFPDFDAAIFFGGVPDFFSGETPEELTKRSRVYGKYVSRIASHEPDFEFHEDGNAFYIFPKGMYKLNQVKAVVKKMDSILPQEFRGYQK